MDTSEKAKVINWSSGVGEYSHIIKGFNKTWAKNLKWEAKENKREDERNSEERLEMR